MHLLITGVDGFVGRRLARLAAAEGMRVSGTCLRVQALQDPAAATATAEIGGVELHTADVTDEATLREVVAQADPDAIVHLAGLAHVGRSWEQMAEYFRVNVLGTERLLAAAQGRRVVLASSAEVYGAVPEPDQPLRETREVAPATPYALTKAAAERLALAKGAVVARSFNLLGPGQSPLFALPSFAAQLAAVARGEKEPVLSVGNLEARRDFLHVDDGAAAYLALAMEGEPGGVYNVASGHAVTIAQALHRLRTLSGVQVRLEPDPERLRPADIPLLRGDAARLRALGWEPARGLDRALSDLWEEARGGGP